MGIADPGILPFQKFVLDLFQTFIFIGEGGFIGEEFIFNFVFVVLGDGFVFCLETSVELLAIFIVTYPKNSSALINRSDFVLLRYFDKQKGAER